MRTIASSHSRHYNRDESRTSILWQEDDWSPCGVNPAICFSSRCFQYWLWMDGEWCEAAVTDVHLAMTLCSLRKKSSFDWGGGYKPSNLCSSEYTLSVESNPNVKFKGKTVKSKKCWVQNIYPDRVTCACSKLWMKNNVISIVQRKFQAEIHTCVQ